MQNQYLNISEHKRVISILKILIPHRVDPEFAHQQPPFKLNFLGTLRVFGCPWRRPCREVGAPVVYVSSDRAKFQNEPPELDLLVNDLQKSSNITKDHQL